MDVRIAACRQPNVVARQTEEHSTDPSHRIIRWFYIVDLEATATEEQHALRDGSVVLSLSATKADADAVAAFDELGVVYYTELSEAERQRMRARIDESRHSPPARSDTPKTNGER